MSKAESMAQRKNLLRSKEGFQGINRWKGDKEELLSLPWQADSHSLGGQWSRLQRT